MRDRSTKAEIKALIVALTVICLPLAAAAGDNHGGRPKHCTFTTADAQMLGLGDWKELPSSRSARP